MTDFATLAGNRVTRFSVAIPWYGRWTADVVIASSAPIAEQTTLVIGDLSLLCNVSRMASFSGSRSALIVGGFGGWGNVVPSHWYANPAGVRLSMVLGDVANEVGERVTIATDVTIGSFFTRESAPAQRLLRLLAGPLWWIDNAGTTQIGDRPSGPITSDFQVIGWSGAKGKFEIATEHYSDWMPGRTFSSPTVTTPQTVSLTTLAQDNDGKLRLEVLAA